MMTHAVVPKMEARGAMDTVGYVRVSTERQAKDKSSLDDQQTAIDRLAAEQGRTIGRVFRDAGVSGGTADRPAFQELVQYCETNLRTKRAPGLILILNQTRLGRFTNPREAAYWTVRFEKSGWFVRFADGHDFKDTLMSTVWDSLGSVEATRYRQNIQDNAKRGARSTAEKGFWQARAPFGYRRVATRKGVDPVTLETGQNAAKGQEVKLTPGPVEEQEMVQWLFRSYASGTQGLTKLARAALVKFPSKKWSNVVVRAILTNPAYEGVVVWFRRPADKEERASAWIRPSDQWVIVRGAHKRLVSPELFQAVQEQLSSNRKQTRAVASPYALTGLIRCKQCGKHYTGGGRGSNPKNIGNDRYRYAFYRCSGSNGLEPACQRPMGTLKKRWVEDAVVKEIGKVVGQPEVRQLVETAIDRFLATADQASAADRTTLERERSKLESERERLVQAIAEGVLPGDVAAGKMRSIGTRLDEVAARLQQLTFRKSTTTALAAEKARLIGLAADFEQRAKDMSGAALRRLLSPWIESAEMDKDARTLTLAIRRVPNAGPFLHLNSMPGRDSP